MSAVPEQGQDLAERDPVEMPNGLADLCARDASFCQPVHETAQRLIITLERWKTLADINTAINHRIRSATDQELYGQPEFWTLPASAGDCEDYVLLKRKTLLALGFPATDLLITVVNDENGDGHAVLTIPTPGGDIVLDNRRDEILRWWSTGYQFVKRQSTGEPSRWVALARETRPAANIASAPQSP